MIRFALALAATIIVATPAAAQTGDRLIHSIFQDHAVLQRDRPIRLWGKVRPGETVTVTLGGNTATGIRDKAGVWSAELPAMPAGGPYTLTVTAGGRTQTIGDILIGDVWLCSGQSNMEMSVAGSLNGPNETAQANDPRTRILTIAHDTATAPLGEFARPVAWKPVTPRTIGDFSAACWFMARELRKSETVPFGLIDASWGGTAINAWRSEASMAGDPALAESLQLLALNRSDAPKAAARWGAVWGDWWQGKGLGAPPWTPGAPGDWRPVPALTYWEGWGVPELADYNGLLFYRTEITLTPEQARKGATLNFGVIDDLDMVFVNDTGVGSMSSWEAARSYRLARGTLKPGVNRIAVAAYDSYGPGGIAGSPDQRAIRFDDGTSVPLPGAARWQYRVASGLGDPPHAPWETAAGLAGIHNGMIAPLGAYGLRGVAWYQGESDAGMAAGYADRLASLMGAWRGQFGDATLPFLIVQLPDWGARVVRPSESGFADIRDEQRRAVERDPHAALVVAIDIGDPDDLHPANKQAVGRRLAGAARAAAYGGTARASGPWATGAERSGGDVTVRFTGYDGILVAYSGGQLIGFELCGTATGTCRFVAARLDGAAAVLDATGGPADRVRFCWGESPLCNLYDSTGLPAGPFELKVR